MSSVTEGGAFHQGKAESILHTLVGLLRLNFLWQEHERRRSRIERRCLASHAYFRIENMNMSRGHHLYSKCFIPHVSCWCIRSSYAARLLRVAPVPCPASSVGRCFFTLSRRRKPSPPPGGVRTTRTHLWRTAIGHPPAPVRFRARTARVQ